MDLVEYSVENAVALVRLNRSPVNALSAQLSQDLLEAFSMAADPEVRAVVVTGQPHFAAGADIKGFQLAYDGADDGGRILLAGSGRDELAFGANIGLLDGRVAGNFTRRASDILVQAQPRRDLDLFQQRVVDVDGRGCFQVSQLQSFR